MSMPISGLAAIADGWGHSLGDDNTITVTSVVNSTSGSNATPRYPAYIRGVNTGLTATALFLMAGTYYLVIRHATPLGNYCKLPSAVIQSNTQALLEEVWPLAAVADVEEWEQNEKKLPFPLPWNFPWLNSPKNESQEADRLLYIGWNDVQKEDALLDIANIDELMIGPEYNRPRSALRSSIRYIFNKSVVHSPSQTFLAKCVKHCNLQNQAPGDPPTRLLWLRNKSVTVKNLVLLAIWEWMSLWLVFIMVVGTAIYNGFAAGAGNPDRYPRLVLILVYALAFMLHFVYTWVCFCRTYTNLGLNGCWTLLSNANFAVKMVDEVKTMDIKSMTWEYKAWCQLAVYESFIFGSTRLVPTYRLGHTKDYATFQDNKLLRYGEHVLLALSSEGGVDQAPKGLVELQEVEIKSAEKATEVAMERIIFNASILLGISVVTGFSTWTTSQLTDATSTQLGSLALLASTASGIAAMLSSAQNLKAWCPRLGAI